MNTTTLFFVANIIFCAAYVVRDILWLRVMTIVACLCTFPYFLMRESPLYSAWFWQSAFIIINAVNLTFLIIERRPVQLTAEQQRLYTLVFRMLTPREMLKLLNIAKWAESVQGETIVKKGVYLDKLLLIFEGKAEVRVDNNLVTSLTAGQFIGEMSYITGNPASADVITGEDFRYIIWERSDLNFLFQKIPALEKVLNVIIGKDMAVKLTK